jgi:hypothetical protein
MPPFIFMILGGLQTAIQEFPQIIALVTKAKEFIAGLTGAKLITKAQQDALHARIDAISEAAQRGEIPPAWQVEPDPE